MLTVRLKLTQVWGGFPLTGSPGVFNSQTCPHGASSNYLLAVQVFPSPRGLLLGDVGVLGLCLSVCPILGLLFSHDNSLTDLRRVADVFGLFNFLLVEMEW